MTSRTQERLTGFKVMPSHNKGGMCWGGGAADAVGGLTPDSSWQKKAQVQILGKNNGLWIFSLSSLASG